MKKLTLILAVLVVSVVGMGVPTWAASVATNTSTVGSGAFGFEPTAANLSTFTHRNNATTPGPIGSAGVADALVCVGSVAAGFSCTASNYISRAGADGGGNASLPGAYTSSPNRQVSATTDWGCGINIATGACTDDAPFNEADLVLDNDTTADGMDGMNTAPGVGISDVVTNCGIPAGCGVDGIMIGTMTSVVNIEGLTGEDGMPSGSITFTRTPNGTFASTGQSAANCGATNGSQAGLACNDVSISQVLNQTIAGLYTFTHTDVSDAPFNSVSARSYNNVAGAPGGTLSTGIPDVAVRSVTSVVQAAMGGDAESTGGDDTLTWGTMWTNNGAHPGGGVQFSPGLNVANWAGDNSAIAFVPANTPDANGFR